MKWWWAAICQSGGYAHSGASGVAKLIYDITPFNANEDFKHYFRASLGEDLDDARARAYAAYELIDWNGKFCRGDIGEPRPVRPGTSDPMILAEVGELAQDRGDASEAGLASPLPDPGGRAESS